MNRFLGRLKTRTGITATIAAVVVGAIFCRLGLWQLERADQKRAILEHHNTAMKSEPLSVLVGGDTENQLYRQVILRGVFDQRRQFLIDNRIVAGQAGFEVITPYFLHNEDLPDNSYVLVNRGWIGHGGDRLVAIPEDPQLGVVTTLKGIVTKPSKGLVLGESAANSESLQGQDQWPVILQYADYGTIAAKLDKMPLLDAVVVAAEGQDGMFQYNWQPVASGVEKHLGYAFQWFAMLAALITLYLYLMVFKKQ